MPPITLNNRYQYNPDTDLLGTGGMGAVYKAYDNEHEHYVAIKKFNAADSLKYSLKAEFQKSIHFSHGNLVRAYDFFSTNYTLPTGETHETQYGVMELIAGGDLAKYLKTKPPLPELLEVVKGILRGLAYLHTPDPNTDKGIVIHRDIKPANILIFRNNQGKPIPKITDFNIAKENAHTLSTVTVVGTPEYMSPEQILPNTYAANGKLLPNTDLWALGVLLCDHLLNQSVFNGLSFTEITHNVLTQPLPTTDIQNLPAPFNQMVAQCLVRNAQQRIQSAKELLAMIGRYENSIGKTIEELPKNQPAPKTHAPFKEEPIKPAAPKSNTPKIAAGVMLLCLLLGYWFYPTTPKNDVVISDKTDTTQTSPADMATITTEQPNANADTPKPTPNTNEPYTQSINEGNTLFVQGRYTQAKKKYETALQHKSNDKAATDGIKKCNEQLKPKEQPTIAKQTPQETPPPPIIAYRIPQETPPPPKPAPATTTGGGSKPSIKMVSIPGKNFKMSETEVTTGQYLAFCEATNSHYPQWLEQDNEYNIHTGTNDAYKEAGMSESNTNYPITGVSALDADAFCRWMGGRLPTEQEWEYAAKGGQSYEYAGSDNINEVAWYDGKSGSKVHPVKQKRANGYGLYDMSGNVWEWTSSAKGSDRVLRGGCWLNYALHCRTDFRYGHTPSFRGINHGFRLVFVP